MTGGEKSSANGCQDFHHGLNEFRHKDIFCDVTIYGDDDVTVQAHSIVLAAGSEVLKNTLTYRQPNQGMQQKHGFMIKIDGISGAIWKLLLDFLYLRRLSVQLSPAVLKELYHAAKILGIKNLVASLGSLIETMDINVETSVQLDNVNVKLSRRVKQREHATQAGDPLEPDAAPPRSKKQKVDPDDADFVPEADEDDEDEDYTPGRKSITSQIKQRLKGGSDSKAKGKSEEEANDLRCINPDCRQLFSSLADLSNHHFTCIMAPTAYRLQEYAYKDDGGKLIYSDPFQMDGGIDSPFATLIEGDKDKMYQCGHCDRKERANRMIMHLAYVHGKRRNIHCRRCKNTFKDLRCFLDHYLTAHTSETFTCVHCFKSFENRNKMKRHIIDIHVNNGQPTHMCRGCGKMFFRAAHARRHETYHQPMDQRRVHPCKMCYKKFCSKADLAKHEQTHDTDKNFKCSQCNFKSNRKTNVVLHERSHGIITANYMCITCGRYYLAERAFNTHLEATGHEGKHVTDLTNEDHQHIMELSQGNMSDDEDYSLGDMSQSYMETSQSEQVSESDVTTPQASQTSVNSDVPTETPQGIAGSANGVTSQNNSEGLQAHGNIVKVEHLQGDSGAQTVQIAGDNAEPFKIHFEASADAMMQQNAAAMQVKDEVMQGQGEQMLPEGMVQISQGQIMKGEDMDAQMQGQFVEGQMMQQGLVEGQIIDGQMVAGQMVEGQLAEGQMIEGQMVDGQMVQGQMIDGQMVQGQLVDGQMIQGQMVEGQLEHGQGDAQEIRFEVSGEPGMTLDQEQLQQLIQQQMPGMLADGQTVVYAVVDQ